MSFTLVTRNPRKISTIIKVFRIKFTSFGIKKSKNIHFWQNSTLTIFSRKFKRK